MRADKDYLYVALKVLDDVNRPDPDATRLNDNDSGVRKQYLEWKPGMEALSNPTSWFRVRFGDAP